MDLLKPLATGSFSARPFRGKPFVRKDRTHNGRDWSVTCPRCGEAACCDNHADLFIYMDTHIRRCCTVVLA